MPTKKSNEELQSPLVHLHVDIYNLLFFSRSNFFGDLGWLFISLSVGWIYNYV